jgi:hypothetical protein
MLAQVEHKGRIVRDDDGHPIQRAWPLVSLQEWESLQAAIDSARRAKLRAFGAPLLLKVAKSWPPTPQPPRVDPVPEARHRAHVWLAGDWEAIWKFGDAMGNLARFMQELGIEIQQGMLTLDQS